MNIYTFKFNDGQDTVIGAKNLIEASEKLLKFAKEEEIDNIERQIKGIEILVDIIT